MATFPYRLSYSSRYAGPLKKKDKNQKFFIRKMPVKQVFSRSEFGKNLTLSDNSAKIKSEERKKEKIPT